MKNENNIFTYWGVSWSLIGYKCAAGTLLTHPIHVYSICEKAYLFIYTSHNLYPVHVFGTFKKASFLFK